MKIVYWPDPVLLTPAALLEEVDDEVRARIAKMKELMVLEDGVGLAAPQVGWGVKLLLASDDGELENTRVYVNPRIVEQDGGKVWGSEGCLSFPGIYGEVQRDFRVKVEALDEFGEPFEEVAEDFYARVLQHEIDHLEGKIFVNKMRPADRLSNKQKLEDLMRRFEERAPLARDGGSPSR